MQRHLPCHSSTNGPSSVVKCGGQTRDRYYFRMFTYISLGTNDPARAARFYDAVLAPLGLRRCDTTSEPNWEDWVGWGTYEDGGAREIALWLCKPFNGQAATAGNGTMVALQAKSWEAVQQFHAAALVHGGQSGA